MPTEWSCFCWHPNVNFTYSWNIVVWEILMLFFCLSDHYFVSHVENNDQDYRLLTIYTYILQCNSSSISSDLSPWEKWLLSKYWVSQRVNVIQVKMSFKNWWKTEKRVFFFKNVGKKFTKLFLKMVSKGKKDLSVQREGIGDQRKTLLTKKQIFWLPLVTQGRGWRICLVRSARTRVPMHPVDQTLTAGWPTMRPCAGVCQDTGAILPTAD